MRKLSQPSTPSGYDSIQLSLLRMEIVGEKPHATFTKNQENTMNLKELKTACFQMTDEASARVVASRIARELSNGATTQYSLSHKCVWEATHVHLSSAAATEKSAKKAAEPITFAQVCATIEREENFALAALFVSVWLFSQWLSLLLWIAPRAIHSGQVSRQCAIAAANAYTKVSYELTHKSVFPNPLPETPAVDAEIARFRTEVLPAARADLKAEVVACLEYSREFYLDSALRLLSLLKASNGSVRENELQVA